MISIFIQNHQSKVFLFSTLSILAAILVSSAWGQIIFYLAGIFASGIIGAAGIY